MTEVPPQPLVCIVEDDDAVRRSITSVVDLLECSVAAFASAEEYLDQHGVGVPHLLILDVRLPGMTGLDLLERLKRADHTPPIVVVTGHAGERLAFDDWPNTARVLPKPFHPREMVKAIESALPAR